MAKLNLTQAIEKIKSAKEKKWNGRVYKYRDGRFVIFVDNEPVELDYEKIRAELEELFARITKTLLEIAPATRWDKDTRPMLEKLMARGIQFDHVVLAHEALRLLGLRMELQRRHPEIRFEDRLEWDDIRTVFADLAPVWGMSKRDAQLAAILAKEL